MDHAQSFTARRSAASNLPSFQLPPPDLSVMHAHKFPYQPSAHAVSSVLTPPVGLNNELSSSSSGSGSSTSAGITPYQPSNYWPQQSSQSYSYNSGSTGPQMPSPYTNYPLGMGRNLYSPSLNSFQQRNSNSSAASENLPAPPYELNLPSFQTNGNSGSSHSGPALAPQQQQQQLSNLMMNSQQPASQTPQQGAAVHAPANYGARPPPTPTYSSYGSSTTPQQSTFPAYSSAAHSSPSVTSGAQESRPVSITAHSSTMQPPSSQYQPRPYPSYALPAMSSSLMSNMHNSGSQISMPIGQYQSQQHTMYGQHQAGTATGPNNDRPFKCDQCPQSFNRNHDLKRHKRIHLAVKPFPCTHCDKSFSRKDALKVCRHDNCAYDQS